MPLSLALTERRSVQTPRLARSGATGPGSAHV